MADAFSLSFEYFPPKTPEGMQSLLTTAKKLALLNPDFFSVTYGAGGSTREGTLDTVRMLMHETNVFVAPHLACIGSSREAMVKMIQDYRDLGVRRMVVLRGDIPSGMGEGSEFKHASDLVKLVRDVSGNHFHIDVAAYPECHPQSPDAYRDLLYFKQKVEAGANSAITQYFFNPDAYFYFVDECARQGIFVPIVPGIMPIVNFPRLIRFSNACGAEIPQWIQRRVESYLHDEEAIKGFGLEVVTNLCQTLIDGGAPGLHFYTLNQHEATNAIIRLLHFPETSHQDTREDA